MTEPGLATTEASSGGVGSPPLGESRFGIFGNRQFSKLFFGSLLGNLADRIYQTALIAAAYVMFSDKASEDYKGTLQIVATVPLLILYPLSSSLVDTVNRRRLLTLVKGVKVLVVMALVPLLWRAAELAVTVAAKNPDLALRDQLVKLWPWCLAVVVLLNIITVPFGPARAAAVPDVTTEEQRSLGASLLATSGLVALLLGSYLGFQLAQSDNLGPAYTIFVASALYAAASLLFARLPDSVAVPGKSRRVADAPESSSGSRPTVRAYLSDLWQGVRYCFTRPSILALILFETTFWTLGSAVYLLLDFHGRTVFGLTGDALSRFSGNTFLPIGVGLLLGALGVGKICRKASPILTYTPGFTLIAVALYLVFRSSPDAGAVPLWLYPVLFGLGFGGGSLLGRVDADVLTVSDPTMRGRVFSIKGMFFAATILCTVVYLSESGLSDDDKKAIALWLPRAFLMLIPISFALSWIVDVAIWAPKGDSELPGPLHEKAYAFIRWTARVLGRIMFRYEVIGAEKIPKTGACVLAANHASFIDPILLAACTDRVVQYIMYSAYYRSIAHPVFRFMRCIPVDEKNQLAALKAGANSLHAGACIGIFPEGRVSDDGKLQPPQGGALFLAQRAGAPVVPVAIKGNFAALPRGAWFPRFSKITLIVCDPLTVDKDLSRKELAALGDKLMEVLAQQLELPPPEKTADKTRER